MARRFGLRHEFSDAPREISDERTYPQVGASWVFGRQNPDDSVIPASLENDLFESSRTVQEDFYDTVSSLQGRAAELISSVESWREKGKPLKHFFLETESNGRSPSTAPPNRAGQIGFVFCDFGGASRIAIGFQLSRSSDVILCFDGQDMFPRKGSVADALNQLGQSDIWELRGSFDAFENRYRVFEDVELSDCLAVSNEGRGQGVVADILADANARSAKTGGNLVLTRDYVKE